MGDSPYQSFSAFAGNPYFIDLEQLIREGLLTKEECDKADFGDSRRYISYDRIYRSGFRCLERPMIGGRMGWPGRGLRGKNLQRIRAAFWSRFTVWPLKLLGRKQGNTAFIWL